MGLKIHITHWESLVQQEKYLVLTQSMIGRVK